MPARNSYIPGTPNWVDLQTTNVDAAKVFYGTLFGWQFDDVPMPEGSGTYSMARKDDAVVAAIGSQAAELAKAGAPPMWNTYFAVEDVDASAAKVGPAGGTLAMPPADVFTAGRMAFALDPANAAFAMWQAKDHIGATLVNEPGTVVWNELITEDPPASFGFYADVLGLTTRHEDLGGRPYTTFQAAGSTIGGATPPPMSGIPNHWHVYFSVADAAETTRQAVSLGGDVVVQPSETPIGILATVRDPQGGYFSIHAPN